jgi:hypothetical protein
MLVRLGMPVRRPTIRKKPAEGAVARRIGRGKIPADIMDEVLTKCRRRCCLCFGLDRHVGQKKGQIAHIDRDRNNNDVSNLAFLCLEHHNEYDTKPSQSKGITSGEVRRYQSELFRWIECSSPRSRANPVRGGAKPRSPSKQKPPTHADLIDDFTDDFGRFSSLAFFADRLARAFPGVRGAKEFTDPATIVNRLSLVLKDPLVLQRDEGKWRVSPIWWWGRGNNPIRDFSAYTGGRFVMDGQEFCARRLVVANFGSDRSKFVYVESEAQKPSGAYRYSDGDLARATKSGKIESEEYARFRGRPITLAEYEDGAAEIGGKPVALDGTAQAYLRYLTRYNVLIAAHNSPINNSAFDGELERLLDGELKRPTSLKELIHAVLSLPPRKTAM